jgi:hypothetical protein
MFALERFGKRAPQHPEWKEKELFKSLTGYREAMEKFTESDWLEIVAVTHAGMSVVKLQWLHVQNWSSWIKSVQFAVLVSPLRNIVK